MTMNGAVLPVLAMYIVAAEEQVSERACDKTFVLSNDVFQFDDIPRFIKAVKARNHWFGRVLYQKYLSLIYWYRRKQ